MFPIPDALSALGLRKYVFYVCILFWVCVRYCTQAFSNCRERGLLSPCGGALLVAAASLAVEHGLSSAGSVVVAHGLCCSAACGLFPDQGSNLCPLH